MWCVPRADDAGIAGRSLWPCPSPHVGRDPPETAAAAAAGAAASAALVVPGLIHPTRQLTRGGGRGVEHRTMDMQGFNDLLSCKRLPACVLWVRLVGSCRDFFCFIFSIFFSVGPRVWGVRSVLLRVGLRLSLAPRFRTSRCRAPPLPPAVRL